MADRGGQQLVDASFIHSSEVWCWMMNSSSSWASTGVLGPEDAVEVQVVAVGHAPVEAHLRPLGGVAGS
jgi:hypothetical protein